jgi:hypothetical protein
LVVGCARHGPGTNGTSQRRCDHGEKPEQFAVRLFAQVRDDFMESQIYEGHETEKTCKQQNLGERIDHSDESNYVKIRRLSFDKLLRMNG